MADMTFTTALDDRGVREGLERVERQARRAGSGIGRVFRFAVLAQGVRMATGMAGEAISAYTEKFESGRAVVERYTDSLDRLKTVIGREVVGAMRAVEPEVRTLTNAIGRAYVGSVNAAARLMGGDPEGVDAARAGEERLDRQIAMWRAMVDLGKDMTRLQRDVFKGGTGLDERDAEILDANVQRNEMLDRLRAMRQRAAQAGGFVKSEDVSMITEAIERQFASRIAEIMARFEQPPDEEETYKRDIARRDALEALDLQVRGNDIDVLRLRNLDQIADRKTVELDFERQILAVRRNQNLDDEDQERLVARLQQQRDQTLAALRGGDPGPQFAPSLQARPAFAGAILSQVFGPGGGSASALPSLIREQTQILRQIERKTGGPAAFAP